MGFLGGTSGKEPACQCRRRKRYRLGRFPGGEYGNPLQYSFLENPMDRGAEWSTVQKVTKSQTWLKKLAPFLRDFWGCLLEALSNVHPMPRASDPLKNAYEGWPLPFVLCQSFYLVSNRALTSSISSPHKSMAWVGIFTYFPLHGRGNWVSENSHVASVGKDKTGVWVSLVPLSVFSQFCTVLGWDEDIG